MPLPEAQLSAQARHPAPTLSRAQVQQDKHASMSLSRRPGLLVQTLRGWCGSSLGWSFMGAGEPLRLPQASALRGSTEIKPAPLPERLAAAVFDAVIICLSFAVFVAVVGLARVPVAFHGHYLAVYAAVLAVLAVFYKVSFCLLDEDTFGLAVLGLRLARFDRGYPGWRDRIWRLGAATITTAALGAGIWWLLLSREKLAWHDLMSRTCVVRADALPPPPRLPRRHRQARD